MNNKQSARNDALAGQNAGLSGQKFEQWVRERIQMILIEAGFHINENEYSSLETKANFLYRITSACGQYEAMFGSQSTFFKYFDQEFGDEVKSLSYRKVNEIWVKTMRPDFFIFGQYLNGRRFFNLFEVKCQESSGSVDEKIAAAPFKQRMWRKLLDSYNIELHCTYILSPMFGTMVNKSSSRHVGKKQYSEVMEWLAEHGIRVLIAQHSCPFICDDLNMGNLIPQWKNTKR